MFISIYVNLCDSETFTRDGVTIRLRTNLGEPKCRLLFRQPDAQSANISFNKARATVSCIRLFEQCRLIVFGALVSENLMYRCESKKYIYIYIDIHIYIM